MANNAYWNKYYQFWDDFVQNWFESRAKPQDKVSKLYREVVDFNADELPEPYLGDPQGGVDAVFLNLNPGMSVKGKYGTYKGKNLEATKFYSNIGKPTGWLIREFTAAGTYRRYITKWSCLNPMLRKYDPEVCGVEWWQGNDPENVGGRMKWVRQVYGNKHLCPSRVFAPEICPFHSPKFPTNGLRNLTTFIKDHVIVPASRAVIENELPFAIAVGAPYAKVLSTLGAHLENEWTFTTTVAAWPKKKNGEHIHRTYKLYTLNIEDIGCARFLVTYAPGGNIPPRQEFKSVETVIRKYVTRNVAT